MLFFTEARLYQTEDKKHYAADQSSSYRMFKRYLSVFDRVLVVARVATGFQYRANESTRVDNAGVEVLPLPHYIGPHQYLKTRNKLLLSLRSYIDSRPEAAMICRLPGTIGTAAARYLVKKKRPYGVEVVGDPLDVFASGSFSHPLRPVFRHIFSRDLKIVIKKAAASIYVTKATLQKRYPPANNQFSTYSSNVMLPPDAFVRVAKRLKREPPYSIVTVGTLDAMYKSPDVAIEAMALLKKKGLNVALQWVGNGRYRDEMIARAQEAGVADRVNFVGNVGSAQDVRGYLDSADLFLLPSRTEGLPRAMVEAMARGLPCIGTKIGGIPELLDESALVPVNDPRSLAEKIELFLTTPGLADAQASRNLQEAQCYAFERLEARRKDFYHYLKSVS
jgi:glycosyltransferase involved in cell wall biosynthesis